jgi:hypothetical protein
MTPPKPFIESRVAVVPISCNGNALLIFEISVSNIFSKYSNEIFVSNVFSKYSNKISVSNVFAKYSNEISVSNVFSKYSNEISGSNVFSKYSNEISVTNVLISYENSENTFEAEILFENTFEAEISFEYFENTFETEISYEYFENTFVREISFENFTCTYLITICETYRYDQADKIRQQALEKIGGNGTEIYCSCNNKRVPHSFVISNGIMILFVTYVTPLCIIVYNYSNAMKLGIAATTAIIQIAGMMNLQ